MSMIMAVSRAENAPAAPGGHTPALGIAAIVSPPLRSPRRSFMSDSQHPVFTPEQEEFLRTQRVAAFATGRKDGSPQLSHIVYDYDGSDIVISVKSYTAKWHNAKRQPRVALLVHDGRKQLVIYGRAEAVSEDPARMELTVRVFRRLSGNPDFESSDDFVASMNEQKRTILRITPEKATMQD
jgi:PPOX class probable F420-dependent enzyme